MISLDQAIEEAGATAELLSHSLGKVAPNFVGFDANRETPQEAWYAVRYAVKQHCIYHNMDEYVVHALPGGVEKITQGRGGRIVYEG